MTVYNRGLIRLQSADTLDLRWLLLKGTGYTFDADHNQVSDLTPGSNEVTVSGYVRQALTGGGITIDDAANTAVVAADGPDFGTLAAGESATALVLYEHVTTDSDSIPVCYYAFASTATDTFDPFVLTFPARVIARYAEAA